MPGWESIPGPAIPLPPPLQTELVFVNVEEAKESIPRNRLCQAGNRFLGSLIGLQIRALAVVVPALQAGNRFLGSLKGLQIRALESQVPVGVE